MRAPRLPTVFFALAIGCAPTRAPARTPSEAEPSATDEPSARGDVPDPRFQGALELTGADPFVSSSEPAPRFSAPRRGKVAPAEIEVALMGARAKMVACALRGTLVVRMVIALDGSVTATVARDRLVAGEASCALEVVRALRLAPREDDAAEALVPLVFR